MNADLTSGALFRVASLRCSLAFDFSFLRLTFFSHVIGPLISPPDQSTENKQTLAILVLGCATSAPRKSPCDGHQEPSMSAIASGQPRPGRLEIESLELT